MTAIDIPEVDRWEDVEVFFSMAESLVEAGASSALMQARRLRHDERSEAQLLAGLTFGEVALAEGPHAGRALEELVAMLDERDDVLALFGALEGIGFLSRAPSAAPALRRLVGHESPEVRASLAGALHSAHEPGDAATEASLILLAADPEPGVREEAVRGLVRLSGWMTEDVRAALAARARDESTAVALTALSGLARVGEEIEPEALAAVLTADILESLPERARLQALEAAALAATPEVFDALGGLRRTWRSPDARSTRVLMAALAWCAPPEMTASTDDRPPFDQRLARWLTGKRCIIGLRHINADGETTGMTQIHGEILTFNPTQLVIRDLSDGDDLSMPADTSVFRYAPVGDYRLRSTGEVVTDPDAECRWAIQDEPAVDSEDRGAFT